MLKNEYPESESMRAVPIEETLADLLLKKGLTLTTAESCTGGLISSKIVSIAGVSAVFKGGFVTYANEAKVKLLGVKEETLAQFGAVSEQTAYEMALGAANSLNADVAVAVTGIAGPDGGTKDKPVGLVYIGFYVCGNVYVNEYYFNGTRTQIREQTAERAMQQLAEYIASDKE